MSKVLKVVAVVAIAVAVVVFAPQLTPLLVSVVGTTAAAAITSVVVGMAITAALTAVSSLFRKPPKTSESMTGRLNTSVNPVAPRKIVFGLTAAGNDARLYETYGAKKDQYFQVVALASHKLNAIKKWYVETDLTWQDGSLVAHQDGVASVRAVAEGTRANAAPAGSGSYWTSSSSFTGCAYAVIDYKISQTAWPSGIPQRQTFVVEGCPVYDPRRDSSAGGSGPHRINNQSTWTYREGSTEIGRNPALCLLTYLVGWRINGHLAWGMGLPASTVDLDSFRTYANICEEGVTTQAGTTVQRYTCDGIFSTADAHETVISAITASMGATKMVDAGGAYRLIGGYDDTMGPKIAFTADHLVSPSGGSQPYVWQPGKPARETFNIVRGRFADPANLYQLAEWGSPIEVEPLVDGIPRTLNVDLGCVSRPETAQRIAKQMLLREHLCPGTFAALFEPFAFTADVGSLVTLSLPKEGWNNKLFRVIEHTETHDMYYQLTLKEESPAIYAWDREEKPLPAAIRPPGYDPRDTLPVTGIAISSETYVSAT